jgi:hypothetical protein
MPPTNPETGKPKRTVVRLTAAQRAEKAITGIGAELDKASMALIRVAEGHVKSGDHAAARRALDVWQSLHGIAAKPETPPADAPPTS